ncbi:hypothetical protein BDR07DRAFT_362291 [Suillus spraguei]|nr:hypothetical protein BDR07DRAFT_362291 [Suillus spraguei]
MKMPGEIQLVKDVDSVAEFDVVASKRRSARPKHQPAPCTTSTTSWVSLPSSISRVRSSKSTSVLSSIALSKANSVMSKRSRQDAMLKSSDNKKKHKGSSIRDSYNAENDDDNGEEEVVNIVSDMKTNNTIVHYYSMVACSILNQVAALTSPMLPQNTLSPLSFLPDLVRNR